MRVVVNQLTALKRKTGIGHYTEHLVRCLRAQADGDRIDVYPSGLARHAYQAVAGLQSYLDGVAPERDEVSKTTLPSLRQAATRHLRRAGLAALSRHFRGVCARQRYDVYHEPNFIPLLCDCPVVTTLHDLSVLLHPEWHPRQRVAHFEREFTQAVARCVHFLTVSEFIRHEVIRTLGVAPARVTSAPNGIRPELRPLPQELVQSSLKRLGLPARYLLYVGTIEPRKNLLTLLRAYCSLPDKLRGDWPLLLVGGWGWGTAEVGTYWHEHARHRGVVHVGYTDDAELAALYNGARALAYPSLYEGFGLPPLEMMACGGAVLASNVGAIRETVGGEAHLIAPEDLDGWRQSLHRILIDDDWWHMLRRGAEARARPYTWERCAAITLRVYRSLSGPAVATYPQARRAAG